MVVVGNSTMIHIFVGENPSSIGVFPYTPQFVDRKNAARGFNRFSVQSEFANSHPAVDHRFYRCRYRQRGVGRLNYRTPNRDTMLVDVGTNGEIMYLGKDGLSATSCATGPAFEGAAISHGMHAVSGAIDAVKIEKNSGQAVCSIIQQNPAKPKKPAGLCGTGVISTVAELYRPD